MYSACNKCSFLLSLAFKVCYGQEFDVVPTRRFSQGFALKNWRVIGAISDIEEIVIQHAVSIRWTMCKEGSIVFLIELESEGESVVSLLAFRLYVILDIPDIFTPS